MKRTLSLALCAAALFAVVGARAAETVERDGKTYRKISVAEYRDKMKGGWIGQIAGVCWGAPTEFRWTADVIPEGETPKWTPDMINNAFGQDDLYVEMTFLKTMEEYGLDVDIRQAGIDFANSGYPLWHANVCGRHNLRSGIAPPYSSHPAFNKCADDIDYQIEADFSGLISPGMPNNAVRLGEKFGRLMNYGDGVYAGQFVGAMYAEAFFETDVVKIIEKALEAIPAESQYAEMVRDLLAWKKELPNDWEACRAKVHEKYMRPEYRRHSCSPLEGSFNIDAKINGAYILVGLLYGEGDLDKTIVISTRCGQDSDCNQSNAGGVLFTTLGFSALPGRFSEELDETRVFSHTAYNFPALLDVCESLAIQAIEKEGGFVAEEDGARYLYIAQTATVPSDLTSCAEPADSPKLTDPGVKYTEDELEKIEFREYSNEEILAKYFAGFAASHMGADMNPGFRAEYRGRKNVFMTH
ncbi:MAG: ADP-ribosylglycohydrolase family protein, partial [Thermoguttaceae bacterium]|nr:ADP-ribosylglycohydrolase family protein [Thermoguttaceae bacterium]